jgi:hypothetical protein
MRYDRSVQEQIDRKMCKPGYTWNDTLGKCLGGYKSLKDPPRIPDKPQETADGAIKQEKTKRSQSAPPPMAQSQGLVE